MKSVQIQYLNQLKQYAGKVVELIIGDLKMVARLGINIINDSRGRKEKGLELLAVPGFDPPQQNIVSSWDLNRYGALQLTVITV